MAQKTYHTLVFRVHALTNLHVGAGDSFYGAVDKAVQTDASTGLPTIHAHSLKGALREYFEEEKGYAKNSAFIEHIFGSDVKEDPKNAQQGEYQFFGADLLALPVPERSHTAAAAFHLASKAELLAAFFQKTRVLGCAAWPDVTAFTNTLAGTALQTGAPYAAAFAETALELPTVARNQLDNGISENLWYEEFVPHEALFGAIVRAPQDSPHLKDFIAGLRGANEVVQLGANATVGYGYCQFTLLHDPLKNTAQ